MTETPKKIFPLQHVLFVFVSDDIYRVKKNLYRNCDGCVFRRAFAGEPSAISRLQRKYGHLWASEEEQERQVGEEDYGRV